MTYGELKIQLCKDSIPLHFIKATQNFLQQNMPDFLSSQKWTSHSTDLNPLHYSVWDTLQKLVYGEKRKPFANSKIFSMLSQTNGMMLHQTARIRKAV